MNPARTGGSTLAILAILFLLGLGFAAYAFPQTGTPAQSSSTSTSSGSPPPSTPPPGVVSFKLVPVATTAKGAVGANGSAGLSVTGQTFVLTWGVTGAAPGQQLQMVVAATASNAGSTKTFELNPVTVNPEGSVEQSANGVLDPGTYAVGLTVIVPGANTGTVAFTSVPATAQVVVGSPQAVQSTTATGNALSYSLVPLPVYLGGTAPANYSFKEGGALIAIYGDRLQVTTSFIGTPSTEFYNVLQTVEANVTIGTVTTGASGGAVFKGNVTLAPGTHRVGLLIFVAGQTSAPVAVSNPRLIEVTLPPASTTTSTASTSSATSTSTASSTSSATTTSESSTSRSSTSATSTSSSSPPPPVLTEQVRFVPVTTVSNPAGYLFGSGVATYSVTGESVYFSLAFSGQQPGSQYSVILTVNGTARELANYTAGPDGAYDTTASSALGAGRFVLALAVFDLSDFNAPTMVLMTVPPTFVVTAHGTSTGTSSSTTERTSTTTSRTSTVETSTSTSTSTTSYSPEGPSWEYRLIPAATQGAPAGYRFATSGTVVVTVDPAYSLLTVALGFSDANPSTTFNAALVLNGSDINLGTMTTSKSGGAELRSSVQVSPGAYLMGVVVYDVSDIAEFGANGPVPVMVTSPVTELAIIGQPQSQTSSTTTSTENSSSTQTVVTSTVTTTVTTLKAGSSVEAQIQDAVANLTIPATVQVTPLASTTQVLDSRFSLSVGQQVGNGLVIAISGENVTGPRVLLINMSKTSPLALYPSLNVTLDGVQVPEAASALQVLNPGTTALYVLVATSDSIQLLVSIPHFSVHIIQVAGELVQRVQAYLSLDAPILAGSIVVITLAFAAAYAARRRYFSVLI